MRRAVYRETVAGHAPRPYSMRSGRIPLPVVGPGDARSEEEKPMPLPDITQLNDFFGSIRATDPGSPEWEEVDAIPATVGSYTKKANTHRGPLKVWAQKQGLSLSGGVA